MMVSKTITVKAVRGEQKKPMQVSKVLSLLPSDYKNLINLPTINGVELSGEIKTKELSLLSSKMEDYDVLEVDECNNDGKYFVVVGEGGITAKVPVKSMTKTLSIIKTTDEIDADMNVGAYRFVEKKGGI